jgi:biopolymer transport protein ExbD
MGTGSETSALGRFHEKRGPPVAWTKDGADEAHRSHDSRPWVFFMIDCFLLLTQFFILTFNFKTDEPVLPRRMPGGIPNTGPCRPPPPNLLIDVHVLRNQGVIEYLVLKQRTDFSGLRRSLANYKETKSMVRISYEQDLQWREVMTVLNECAANELESGLVPLRTPEALGLR